MVFVEESKLSGVLDPGEVMVDSQVRELCERKVGRLGQHQATIQAITCPGSWRSNDR